MKNTLTFVGLLFLLLSSAQAQIPAPEAFFHDYRKAFTPHHRVVDYMHALDEGSARVQLQSYGTSEQGRPLLALFISSEKNMESIEAIRETHMELLRGERELLPDSLKLAICWLSYGVHGNEAGATEAALAMAYRLAAGEEGIDSLLDETLVILDPCLNPDGFDRYVSFYNDRLGRRPHANPYAAEHRENWVTGRVNHYHFDLNRDWAWQTQVESRQRMELYRQWMPHLHIDFHEQFPGNHYYFAPAAAPFHPAIPAWQKDLQETFGAANATAFDSRGWPYFTGEVFDLFYPSYGDTYPILNGAVGMTYEQEGHGRAGLAHAMDRGDTITLADRIEHHMVSGMESLKTAVTQREALIEKQRSFFGNSGEENNSAFVLCPSEDRLDFRTSLWELLDKNGIRSYSPGSELEGEKVRVVDPTDGKERGLELTEQHVIVPFRGNNSTLLQVLMETEASLEDTATYDITSWGLPLAYGNIFEAEYVPDGNWQPISERSQITGREKLQIRETVYAIGFELRSEEAYLDIIRLLGEGWTLRMTTEPLRLEGKEYQKGDLFLLRSDNRNRWKNGSAEIAGPQGQIHSHRGGRSEEGPDLGSSALKILKAPNIALLRDESIDLHSYGFAWHFLDTYFPDAYNALQKEDWLRHLKDYNTAFIPDGDFHPEEEEQEEILSWVEQGGNLILIGKHLSLFGDREDVGVKNKAINDSLYTGKWDDHQPGAVVEITLDPSHPLAYHMGERYYSLTRSRLALQSLGNGDNVGRIEPDARIFGFMGDQYRDLLKESTGIAQQSYGKGNVIYFLDDPLFRGFWKRGQQLMWNAIIFVQ